MLPPAAMPSNSLESESESDPAKLSPLLVAAGIVVLAFFSAWVVNANLSADYPLGDGGLFYVIIKQILAGHFAYPQTIAYNGFQIPFAYSPLAFYCVAAMVKLTALPIPKAMNLWVIVWCALFAPAAYLAARRFLATDVEAFIAAGFTVVFPPIIAWLGMGGGVTRAPGFALFLVASGLTWEAFRKGNLLSAVLAGICAAAALWFHMEFAFLYAATFVILALFARPSFRVTGVVAGVGILLAAPWLVIASIHLHAVLEATHTSHGPSAVLDTLLSYSGITGGGWLSLTGFFCMLAACFIDRNYLWLAWGVAILCLDSRAGNQAAHFPSGLAVAWAAGKLWRSDIGAHLGKTALTLLVGIGFLSAASSARDDSLKYVRLSSSDAADMTWMGTHLERSSDVVTLNAAALDGRFIQDQTFEWLPALSGLRSPITYQGLEWISARETIDRNMDFFEVQWCLAQGVGCILDFIRAKAPGNNVYAYVPAHGRAYPLLVTVLNANSHFTKVFQSPSGTVFRVEWK